MQAEDIKRKVYQFITNTELGDEVTKLLLPNSVPLSFETELWDFKRKSPALGEKPDEETRELHKLETHELIKDIASFHNSYGGYIVFGVEDTGGNRVVGCNSPLDLGDISKRFKSYTGRNIELFQNTLKIGGQNILLMLIPRRKTSDDPVQFLKIGPSSTKKKAAYQKGSIYIRRLDECRPAASTAEDWAFLFSDRVISESRAKMEKDSIPSNLPPRDPDMVQFVGREEEPSSLIKAKRWEKWWGKISKCNFYNYFQLHN